MDTDEPPTLPNMDIFKNIVQRLQNITEDLKKIKQTQQTILERVIVSLNEDNTKTK